MTITPRVRKQMFRSTPSTSAAVCELIRLPPTRPQPLSPDARASPTLSTVATGPAWTLAEHDRFLEALELFPSGPWRRIAEYVGSKTARQTMTHAQKYRQKIARRERGLRVGAPPRKLVAAKERGRGCGDGSVAREWVVAGACSERRLLPSPSSSSSSTSSSSSSSSPFELSSSDDDIENVVLDALFVDAEALDSAASSSLVCGDNDADVCALFDELMRSSESLADYELLAALCDDDDDVDDPMGLCALASSSLPALDSVAAWAWESSLSATAALPQELVDVHDRNRFCGHAVSVLDELALECGDDILRWLSD